ncbi:tetratricopeptide repeat protein [Neorhizobium sp. IRAMC:178]|uniref:tetratricopeptide repeat protein n=1 Tax=Neorhizobium tunisiense TaxID=3144793 RepID=UPI0031F6B410
MKSRLSKVNRGFAIATGTAAALCALTVSLGAEERANLQLTSAMQTECDRLAGSPYDQQRNGEFAPVGISDIDGTAVDACRMAYDATGNPRFAYQLGRALNKTQQADQAMNAYDVAVQAGYAAAKVNFGMLMGRLGDERSEFQLYTEAANGGNVLAAYNLGVAYRDGLGTQPDVQRALIWFEKAAAEGDDTAAFNIGAIYDEGQLVAQDDQTAIAWYDLAAERGNADAMINLGLMYEAGEGIEANALKAAEMYGKAAEKGDVFGAYKFLQMQELGIVPGPSDPATTEGVNSLVLKPGDMEQSAGNGKEI